ncbi:hypothetical protein Bbelb_019100 [Branchiostoma belcheri]|nr:hypothetical protein Bbelb_019100 [Branchiostoma belcheri]
MDKERESLGLPTVLNCVGKRTDTVRNQRGMQVSAKTSNQLGRETSSGSIPHGASPSDATRKPVCSSSSVGSPSDGCSQAQAATPHRSAPFWEHSDRMRSKRKRDAEQLAVKKEELEIEEWENLRKKEEEVEARYVEVRGMVDKTGNLPKTRNNPTTMQMMKDKCTTWYRRRNLARDYLVSTNGSEEGAIIAAFGVLVDLGSFDQVDKLMSSFKQGKIWQLKFNSITRKYEASDENMERSLAAQVNAQLSRRKYQFHCKTLSSVYDPTKKVYVPRDSYIDGIKFRQARLVSSAKLQEKMKSIDIGHIYPVPGHVGATRPFVSLVIMIVDLHLFLRHLYEELRWFKGKENHFIFCFADDGTPETKETSMTVGTLSSWNFSSKVRSHPFQYLLHIVNAPEKAAVFKELWAEHTYHMELMESKPYTIAGKLCTFEFRGGGDESWAATALGETSGAATYPSPWADVTKSNMFIVGGKIGQTWMPWTMEQREAHLLKLEEYMNSLPSGLSESTRRNKRNDFMAANKMRQVSAPLIGKYASTFCPDPLHTECNAWHQFLNTLYQEAVRRDRVKQLTDVLAAPIYLPKARNRPAAQGKYQGKYPTHEAAGDRVRQDEEISAQSENLRRRLEPSQVSTDQGESPPLLGLNMKAVAESILEHDAKVATRHTRLSSFRLIGEHAITMAKYSYRLVDVLATPNEDKVSKVRRHVLGKVAQSLRDAGSLFNKVTTDEAELTKLDSSLDLYFNLYCLFLPENGNLTVWTMAKAVQYYARKLFDEYGTGYGVVSMQGKEAKNSKVKSDLKLTNRSKEEGECNKYNQVFRMEYNRSFYLQEHSPSPSRYNPHFNCRVPSHVGTPGFCDCGREIGEDQLAQEDPELQVHLCTFCVEALDVVACAREGELTPEMRDLLSPSTATVSMNPFTMKKAALVAELKSRKLPASGNVKELRERLAYALQSE